jgi:hypothetical protein
MEDQVKIFLDLYKPIFDIRRFTFVSLMDVFKFKGGVLGGVTIIVGTLVK